MYMEEIKKQFQTLNNINEHWFSQIRKYIDDDNNFQIDEKILEEFNKLYVLLSENYKIDKNEVRKVCSKYLDKSDSEWLDNHIINSLEPYFTFEFMRQLQENEFKQCFEFIDYVFDNVIVRFDPQCAIRYCNEHKITTDIFIDASKMLGGMVNYYINQHYTDNAIIKDINEETSLNVEICNYICKKINDNYLTLQLNAIIDLKK